jgi:hypothetical protein
MLYVIHRGNNPELLYRDGQGPIVHLEADLYSSACWAEENRLRWAFSLSNASANYAQFRSRLDQLNEVNWEAVAARDFRSADVKEGKQAEFLIERCFPWELVARVGVYSNTIAQQVSNFMLNANHRPRIEIRPDWYF